MLAHICLPLLWKDTNSRNVECFGEYQLAMHFQGQQTWKFFIREPWNILFEIKNALYQDPEVRRMNATSTTSGNRFANTLSNKPFVVFWQFTIRFIMDTASSLYHVLSLFEYPLHFLNFAEMNNTKKMSGNAKCCDTFVWFLIKNVSHYS